MQLTRPGAIPNHHIVLLSWSTWFMITEIVQNLRLDVYPAGIIIVYDVTDMESFNNVKMWMDEVRPCRLRQ